MRARGWDRDQDGHTRGRVRTGEWWAGGGKLKCGRQRRATPQQTEVRRGKGGGGGHQGAAFHRRARPPEQEEQSDQDGEGHKHTVPIAPTVPLSTVSVTWGAPGAENNN